MSTHTFLRFVQSKAPEPENSFYWSTDTLEELPAENVSAIRMGTHGLLVDLADGRTFKVRGQITVICPAT